MTMEMTRMKSVGLAAVALSAGAAFSTGSASAEPHCPPNCGPPPAHIGTFQGFSTIMPVYARATERSRVIRHVRSGTKAQIMCQTFGRRADGPLGASRTWDKLRKGGYIPDSRVYTGSDGLVAPTC